MQLVVSTGTCVDSVDASCEGQLGQIWKCVRDMFSLQDNRFVGGMGLNVCYSLSHSDGGGVSLHLQQHITSLW